MPIDVFVKAGTKAVVITGPNTGGKTATLKVGLRSVGMLGLGLRH